MQAAEVAIRTLTDGGVTYFAGMVGSTNTPLVAAVGRTPGARYIPVRHEQVAASIVDATARLTRRPGCILLHSGSGTLAASLGIAAAARESTPMIVLTGTQERQAALRGYSQTTDVLTPLQALTKWQYRVERPADVSEIMRRALIEATTGRPGVVQIDLPIDISNADCDAPPRNTTVYEAPLFRARPLAADIARTAELLQDAKRPVLVVGGGAVYSGVGDGLRRLAERLGAPIVNSATCRGVVSEDHPLSLGPSGMVGRPPSGRAIADADLVITIGSRLSDIQTGRGAFLPAGAPIVQVNIDPTELGRLFSVALGIAADARAFVDDLNAALDSGAASVPADRATWTAGLRRDVDTWRERLLAGARRNGKVQPEEVVHGLIQALPDDAVLSYGAGDHTFYGTTVPARAEQKHLVSSAFGTMGSGLAYAIGAKLACPDRPSVALLGDGELMIQLGDLETLVREKLPVVVVVLNNFRLGSQWLRMAGAGDPKAVEHGNPSFARLGELFGCDSHCVDKPGQFLEAFRRGLASGRPTLIEVLTDPDTHPPVASSGSSHEWGYLKQSS
jgi:acetolactate synthase-1/2/3 large subunit